MHRRCGLARCDWSVARQSASFFTTSLESQESYLTIRNLTLQTFRSVTREFFSLHSTLAQLYNAAALPALHLCSAGSLAITILKRIQDSIFAPAMNPDASKLILMNFPCERRMQTTRLLLTTLYTIHYHRTQFFLISSTKIC